MQIKNKLTKRHEVLPKLPRAKERPNDFQRLVLSCWKNGMTVEDTARIFDIAPATIKEWRKHYLSVNTEEDMIYFMRRARDLGAEDEIIALWFGFDRVDKVSMLLAKKQ